MRPTLSLGLLALLLTACGGVTSLHPASSTADPGSDPRLLGFWVADAEATAEGAGEKPGAKTRGGLALAVGPKEAGGPLHASALLLDEDGHLSTWTWVLLPTEIAGVAYLSHADADVPLDQQIEWSIARYDFPEAGRLRVHSMDEDVVAADVEAALVPGTVSRSEGAGPRVTNVKLTAPTESLRAYLQERGDALWRRGPLVLRRLTTR